MSHGQDNSEDPQATHHPMSWPTTGPYAFPDKFFPTESRYTIDSLFAALLKPKADE